MLKKLTLTALCLFSINCLAGDDCDIDLVTINRLAGDGYDSDMSTNSAIERDFKYDLAQVERSFTPVSSELAKIGRNAAIAARKAELIKEHEEALKERERFRARALQRAERAASDPKYARKRARTRAANFKDKFEPEFKEIDNLHELLGEDDPIVYSEGRFQIVDGRYVRKQGEYQQKVIKRRYEEMYGLPCGAAKDFAATSLLPAIASKLPDFLEEQRAYEIEQRENFWEERGREVLAREAMTTEALAFRERENSWKDKGLESLAKARELLPREEVAKK